jgi:hypothetical protein
LCNLVRTLAYQLTGDNSRFFTGSGSQGE